MDSVTLGTEIEATFVPQAGMIACSLRHRGDELLGQRGGLSAYVENRSTMGIPLLHPWANRLSELRFELAGREVQLDLDPPARAPKLDPGGLPIHGLLAADSGWKVDSSDHRQLVAGFDFGARPDLLAAFPFPHRLAIRASVEGARLSIATTLEASGHSPVPVSFGFHPYLQLPGVPREEWEIEVPVTEQLVLDERGIPTGERVAAEVAAGKLGDRTFDHAYLAPTGPLVLAGGGRRISLAFDSGYGYAQLYAPPDDAVIAYEPMTAPTNGLITGDGPLRMLDPGETYEAVFSIEVDSAR
jgi:aldose 1-epimerase